MHEPQMALTDNKDGLYFYKKITRESVNHLKNGGILAFEIGYNRGEAVKNLLEKNSFENIEVIKDYQGQDRIVIGVKNEIK